MAKQVAPFLPARQEEFMDTRHTQFRIVTSPKTSKNLKGHKRNLKILEKTLDNPPICIGHITQPQQRILSHFSLHRHFSLSLSSMYRRPATTGPRHWSHSNRLELSVMSHQESGEGGNGVFASSIDYKFAGCARFHFGIFSGGRGMGPHHFFLLLLSASLETVDLAL